MTQEDEIARAEASQEAPKQQSMILLMIKTLLRDPSILKKLRRMGPDEQRYIAPPRPYELPEYRKGMKYSTSKEPYVRARRWCNPREPLVVALANELGAYEVSDREFAEAAYWWMKTNMWFALTGFDSASATIRRGSGMCFHFINTYIALCRCAGIKCRYKGYQMKLSDSLYNVDEAVTSIVPQGGALAEAEAELYIDGTWVTAYLAQTIAVTAMTGFPICEFGESSLGLYFQAIPGSIRCYESIPLTLGLSLTLQSILAPATMERVNVLLANAQKLGLQEIENAGGLKEYNIAAKKRREVLSAEELLNAAALNYSDKIIIKNSPQMSQ